MNPYDEVVRALQTLIVQSGNQLGQVLVLTERHLAMTKELMERLDDESSLPLASRILKEVAGAGEKFHTVMIKFPGVGAYPIPLDHSQE